MSIREDEENQEVEIMEDEEVIDVPDIDLDLEDGELPFLNEEELE